MSKFIIEIRTKGFTTAEATLKRTTNQTRKFARASNKAATAGATFRREVSAIRNNMLLYAFAIGGTIAALGRFVKASSDAKEQADQFNIVFGDFAPKAEAFALSIQSSFGIAKSEMVSLLAGLQDTFVPLGFSREKASELSMSIAQLSLDVGAFKNIATGDVAKRMTSALIGNHEAVRELGISLTEHTIKQEAMRLGIIKANEEMTQEAKIMGRISLIAKGTTDAVGNAALTQEEFASRLRGTQGRLLSTAEAVGDLIKPFALLTLNIVDSVANLRSFVIILGGVTFALGAYYQATIIATLATFRFQGVLKRNILTALATGLIVLADKMVGFGKTAEQAAPKVKSLDELTRDLAAGNLDLSGGLNAASDAAKALEKAEESLKETQDKSIASLTLRLALMHEDTEFGKAAVTMRINENRSLTMMESILLKQIDAMIAKNAASKEQIQIDKDAATAAANRAKAETAAFLDQVDMRDRRAAIDNEVIRIQAKLDGAHDLSIQKMEIVDSAIQKIADTMPNAHGQYHTMTNNINDMTAALDLETLGIDIADEQTVKLVESIIELTNRKLLEADASALAKDKQEGQTEATRKAAKVQQDFNNQQRVAASFIMATATALKSLTDQDMSFEQKFSNALRGVGSIMMMIPGLQIPGAVLSAGSMFVGHTGGLIRNNGIQRFATGGMVQGEDNVPIMAQAGEFIMRRSAVQQIGVQNLANMNNGGSAGVTVNIQGNMIGTREFVRDSLIPEIQASVNKA
jgi:hypothetical protein